MTSTATCPICGTSFPRRLTQDLCPKCLLDKRLVAEGHDQDPDQTRDTTGPNAGRGEPAASDHQFGDYELSGEIARGGMGVVYKARHRKLDRVVALKMILRGQLASDDDVERFRREAAAAANLDHPGIVPIYEIGDQEGQHFYSMKLVEGQSLAQRIPEFQNDTRAAIALLEKVPRAVHYAHQRGILHRDLKPANILLDQNDLPLIADLGLAKQMQSDSKLTQSGVIVGTPAYMPPEQATASKDMTTAADIYSVGAMMYELLVGQTPHVADTPVEMVMKVLDKEVQPPREIDRKIDPSLELVCMKCLNRDPNLRYTSAGALADDLSNWLNGRPVSAKPPSITSIVSAAFYNNLRSAIGAALIGAVAGLILGLGLLLTGAATHFGPGRHADLEQLYVVSPGMERIDPWFANVPETVSKIGILAAPIMLLLVGFVLFWLVKPSSSQHALAIALVAGLLMTITSFGFSIGIISLWEMTDDTITHDVALLAQASLQEGAERKVAVDQILTQYVGLQKLEPPQRAKIFEKKVIISTCLAVPQAIWRGLLMAAFACLIPCVGGTLHAFRLHLRDPRISRMLIPYLEVLILLLVVTVFPLLVTANYFYEGGNDSSAMWSASLLFSLIALATIPGFRLWSWPWRWGVYAIVACMIYFLFQ